LQNYTDPTGVCVRPDSDPTPQTLFLSILFSYSTGTLHVTYELCVLQDIYQSAEYSHPLLDSIFAFFLPPAITDIFLAVNGFRCDDRRNFGAGSERFGRQAKSRRLANGLMSSAIIYIGVGIGSGHLRGGETSTDRDLDPFLVRRKNAYSRKISVEVLARLLKGKVWLMKSKSFTLGQDGSGFFC
jgi:hypothetical protein